MTVKTDASALTEKQIAAILELRRARAKYFGTELFADPAWDILLQLFAAKLGGRRLRLADLETLAPRTTLARWAAVLEERGFVSCHFEPGGNTKLSLEISPLGAARMSELLRSLPGLLAPA
jgi:hypothetical protein